MEAICLSWKQMYAKTWSVKICFSLSAGCFSESITSIKLCKNILESWPVNRYWKSLPEALVSLNHRLTFLARRGNFAVFCRQFTSLLKGAELGTWSKCITDLSRADLPMLSQRILPKSCWHALFFGCKGSMWALSTICPNKGTNSCLLFLSEIKLVTFFLFETFEPFCFSSFSFNFSTF